ncbi:GNAT family N-acetyltransferase [Micromonospora sp. KC721]|uniref:GNAT family N-acetyltransferase n=1 Tax=Micromonospora sp. KC721 TaxID=2530380 RepID=UPI001FB6C637|nr:GNAT family N-acetyltransferase [Micromonospora sp. KC721]
MTTTPPRTLDLGSILRALRRRADLSQRELADRSGVPQSTIARIESGGSRDPRFRTIERLVGAMAAGLTISLEVPTDHGVATPGLPAVPHEELRDSAGRHCPAHLDARAVHEPRDWRGAWWAGWYDLPPERWPAPLPLVTYDQDRAVRDRRRAGERVRRAVRIRRVTGVDLPATSWRFVAELPDGELVGELRAHERNVDFLAPYDLPGRREVVLDGVLVATAHRWLGIGRRLLDALVAEMDRTGTDTAYAIGETGGIRFLLSCGFRLEAAQPAALRLVRPFSAAPGPPRSAR